MTSPKRRKSPKSRRRAPKSRRKTPKSRRKATKSRRKTAKSNRRNNNSGGLSRWFNEEWIDVCQLPRIVKCGRNKAERKNYPYCRPRRRINANTPKTAREISKEEIKRRCSKKKKNPYKKVYPKKKTAAVCR
jgi:hypothetical protein